MEKSKEAAVQILKDAAELFKALNKEAEELLAKGDSAGYVRKLRDRAAILIALPYQLARVLPTSVEQGARRRIEKDVSFFADSAIDALEYSFTKGVEFRLGMLLIHRGNKVGDPNDLDKLIKFLMSSE